MCLSSGWHNESLRTRWEVMKMLSLWNEISLASWVLKDRHDATGFCKWHVSHQGDADSEAAFYSDNTENGLSSQLERVRCLNTMISSMLESLLPHLLWKQGNALPPLVLCDCGREGIMPLGWVLFLAHHEGCHFRRGTSARPFPPLITKWRPCISSGTAFSLGSSPPLLPALLVDTIPGRGAQEVSAMPISCLSLHGEV